MLCSVAHLLNSFFLLFFLPSSLILSLLFSSFRSFPYLVTLRHGHIINHAPTLGACHLSRVVDHNRNQGAALSSDAVLYTYRNPCGSRAPLLVPTQQATMKVKKVFIHLIRSGIQYYFYIFIMALYFPAAFPFFSKV